MVTSGKYHLISSLPLSILPCQYVDDNLGVMSVGFLLASPDDAVIWRGPKKNGELFCSLSFKMSPTHQGLIKQFLRDVDWGTLDYLIVDTPPGTSDEHLSIVQYLSSCHLDGAVVITTPQVRRRSLELHTNHNT